MAVVIRRTARRLTKITVVGAGAVGTWTLGSLWLNNDLDDISYAVKRPFYMLARKSGSAESSKKKVVILGSGWGALSFLKKMDTSLYDIKVVSPRPYFFYTPLLCGCTTGVVSGRSIIEPIRDVAPVGSFVRAACQSVDLERREVKCLDSEGNEVSLNYDHLVVSVGAKPNTFGIPGVEEHALFLKEMEHAIKVRKKILNCFETANVARMAGQTDRVKQLLKFVIVGGGPTGVEFCAELSDFIREELARSFPELQEHVKVTLVEALPSLLAMFDHSVGRYVQEHLAQQGVEIMTRSVVKKVEKEKVHIQLQDKTVEQLDCGFVVWVAGVGMRPFTKALRDRIGKEHGQSDRRGLLVDEALRVRGTGRGEVFALGDCAVSGKPPTAQVAAQQGRFLGAMFRVGSEHLIADPNPPAFRYHHQGNMAYIGEGQGATQINTSSVFKLGRSSFTDHVWWRSLYGETDDLRILGPVGFAIWRSVYFSKIYSPRNRFTVASDWLRTSMFGRPVASPVQTTP